jgi:hypothetical protein
MRVVCRVVTVRADYRKSRSLQLREFRYEYPVVYTVSRRPAYEGTCKPQPNGARPLVDLS